MILHVKKSIPDGTAAIPGSKSHTIRALFFASLAEGESVINDPLISDDSVSAVRVLRQLGSDIILNDGSFIVRGSGSKPRPSGEIMDVGNSGTTMRFAASAAALSEMTCVITGDGQIQKRPIRPLLDALNDLGASAFSIKGNGYAPISVTGPLKGGRTTVECMTSQYLSSLLIALPLAKDDSVIIPAVLNEKPYIDMTLWWLDKLGIEYKRRGYEEFVIKGGQGYDGFMCSIPGDYSSATFFAVLAAISGGTVTLENLQADDPQGDKKIFDIIRDMGAKVSHSDGKITVTGRELLGADIDLNAMPDALPALAVLGCFAKGRTRLQNVPQARIKETDRIRVMCEELRKMGAEANELDDGLEIYESRLHNADLSGHSDHRIVMALSVAGAMCGGLTRIDTAEAVSITFPGFVGLMRDIGVDMEMSENE
jgi:3-phosphoshikimate 1-carboxyvinyltransferase